MGKVYITWVVCFGKGKARALREREEVLRKLEKRLEDEEERVAAFAKEKKKLQTTLQDLKEQQDQRILWTSYFIVIIIDYVCILNLLISNL